jgi:hypothetical protein
MLMCSAAFAEEVPIDEAILSKLKAAALHGEASYPIRRLVLHTTIEGSKASAKPIVRSFESVFEKPEGGLLRERTLSVERTSAIREGTSNILITQISFLGFLPLVSVSDSTLDVKLQLSGGFSYGHFWISHHNTVPITTTTQSNTRLASVDGALEALSQPRLAGGGSWKINSVMDSTIASSSKSGLLSTDSEPRRIRVEGVRECRADGPKQASVYDERLKGVAWIVGCQGNPGAAMAFAEEWLYLADSALYILRSAKRQRVGTTVQEIKEVEYY